MLPSNCQLHASFDLELYSVVCNLQCLLPFLRRSQEELSEQIALLTDQLKLISAEQTCPIDLDGYVTRLGTIKAKINVISSVLHSAQVGFVFIVIFCEFLDLTRGFLFYRNA